MERRKNERVSVRLLRSSSKGSRPAAYRLINVSAVGCAIECSECLDAEEGRIVFDLPLPARVDSLRLEAKIVWGSYEDTGGDSRFQYGLCFEEMNTVSRAILDAYLDYLRRDVHVAKLEEAWQRLREVQERIELLVACEERKEAAYLH